MSKQEEIELLEKLKPYASTMYIPDGKEYKPPEGMPILDLPPEAKIYKVDNPTKQKDLLVAFERRYTIPIAMMIAPFFGTNPVPDDVYREAPKMAQSNLFVIYSRSGIEKRGSILNWDAVVVIVKKLCVVRVNCDLDVSNTNFAIRKLFLWSRKNQAYQTVQDPQGNQINAEVLPYIMERYVMVEGIR